MSSTENDNNRKTSSRGNKPSGSFTLNRRGFFGSTVAGLCLASTTRAEQTPNDGRSKTNGLFPGKPLRILPVLAYHLESPREMTSWRSYGGLRTQSGAEAEANRIATELNNLSKQAEFPVEFLPVTLVQTDAEAREAAGTDADMILAYAAGGGASFYAHLAESKAANVMFIRHKTEPYYLWHEIAHWRFLRRNEDKIVEPNMDTDDIVVDDYDEVLWRMRAVYGLKNAKGTKMLAIGSLAAYSRPGQELGPDHARNVWDYEIEIVSRDEFAHRLSSARSDDRIMSDVERQVQDFLDRPTVTLKTERKFVVNSFLVWNVCKGLLDEKNAFNFGFDHCMGRDVIEMLDTPPCLVLALANDAGYTAYCHTDLTHTCPGVLLRWISGKPTFVCNTHFPHDGIFTVAHCAAPMRMNGSDYEPVTIMTHYESDYGAASRIDYRRGQTVTVVIPNLHCTNWKGFRGEILGCPSLPACRSQMDIRIDGDENALIEEMEGFHAQIVYGDYLKEVGYALKKLGTLEWRNFS